jgi:hypothetical protein
MNARIEKDFLFQCGIHFKNEFHINNYEMTLSMLIETESAPEQHIAMDRLIYYVTDVLQSSVFVDADSVDAINLYKTANIRVCELPQEPYDQVIGMILIQKLNAIMEGRMKITDMVFGSTFSEGVRYNIVTEIAEGAFSGKHWWNRSSICLSDNDKKCPKNDNVVKLFSDTKWADLDLQWQSKK